MVICCSVSCGTLGGRQLSHPEWSICLAGGRLPRILRFTANWQEWVQLGSVMTLVLVAQCRQPALRQVLVRLASKTCVLPSVWSC